MSRALGLHGHIGLRARGFDIKSLVSTLSIEFYTSVGERIQIINRSIPWISVGRLRSERYDRRSASSLLSLDYAESGPFEKWSKYLAL